MRLERLGSQLLRYALAGILIYLGAFKFTSVEAHAILLKDVFLLGAAAWSAGEAWRAATPPSER